MITANTSPFLEIDRGKTEPSMILQRWDGDGWVDHKVGDKVVKSPVDIDELPPDKYRLI